MYRIRVEIKCGILKRYNKLKQRMSFFVSNGIVMINFEDDEGKLPTDNNDQSTDLESSLTSEKKVRNNQNHVRFLNRKLKETFQEAYKIQQIVPNQFDKRLILAVCRIQLERGRLDQIKQMLLNMIPNLSNSSKDNKIRDHIEFIVRLESEDLELSNLKATLVRLGKTSQTKNHPLKENIYNIGAYLEVEDRLRSKIGP